EDTVIGCFVILPGYGKPVGEVEPQIKIAEKAIKNKFAVLIPSINTGIIGEKEVISSLDKIFQHAVNAYELPVGNFFIGGFSNGGFVAAEYAVLANQKPNSTFIKPRAIFGVDPWLDKLRFYERCEKEIANSFSDVGLQEATWVKQRFDKIYGSPDQNLAAYESASVFSHHLKDGGNAKYLINTPIKFYTELDVEWMINERKRDLYGWNGTDLIAMINVLRHLGNEHASIEITKDKGYRLSGLRHPHSWSIMDTDDLIEWALSFIRI
ncbi:MAG: hypothetical protein AAGK97_18240, partial [Bacteroidota bacterium]